MKHRPPSRRNYPRMARVNELLREILGDTLERIDDERLELVTVTEVLCDSDLKRAHVYYDSVEGPDGDEVILEAFGQVRHRLQAAIARQARLKRTPELIFEPDAVLRSALRVEDVLRSLPEPTATGDEAAPDSEPDATGAPGGPDAPGDGET